LRMAVGRSEQRIVAEIVAQLSPATRVALDEIIITQASDDSDQLPLFPVRSELAAIKDGTGAVKVETVLDEIAKLKQLRALGLPEALFRNVPAKLVNHYRQRAASEKPRELRRHPPEVRYTCSPRCGGRLTKGEIEYANGASGEPSSSGNALRMPFLRHLESVKKSGVVGGRYQPRKTLLQIAQSASGAHTLLLQTQPWRLNPRLFDALQVTDAILRSHPASSGPVSWFRPAGLMEALRKR
ncbi:MAG: hypothetical protein WCE49_09160, partial [Terrimicrobiaceae bacterium]